MLAMTARFFQAFSSVSSTLPRHWLGVESGKILCRPNSFLHADLAENPSFGVFALLEIGPKNRCACKER
jgi:hypothetical protein